MIDYPAAHSMDTSWFAVDADNNIGFFDSWEGGAVPQAHYELSQNAKKRWGIDWRVYYFGDFLKIWAKEDSDRIIRLHISSESVFKSLGIDIAEIDLNSPHSPNLPSKSICLDLSEPPTVTEFEPESYTELWSHWLLVPSANEAKLCQILNNKCKKYPDSDYIIRFSGDIPLLLVTECPLKTLRFAIALGLIKYVIHLEAHSNLLSVLIGIFLYGVNQQSSYPYKCDGKPLYPLQLQDLPPKFQNAIAANKFDTLRFSEAQKIQPIEHMPCATWDEDGLWVDTEGNERLGYPEYPLKS